MALFSRREIQARINEVVKILTCEQLRQLVVRLNGTNRAAIEAMWELAWVSALMRVGTVAHEPALVGATRFPDVHFKNAKVEFVADIATVSDLGYEKDNPIDRLYEELGKLYNKHGVVGGFSVGVQSRFEGEIRDQKVRLLLPAGAEIPEFVRRNFDGFVRGVSEHPDRKAAHQAPVAEGGLIRLAYNPKQRPYDYGASHVSFDFPYSKTRNPVSNALKGKKRQLTATNFAGIKGIILCDGDCSVIKTSTYSGATYTLEQIVSEFFRQNSSIAFVFTIGVATHLNPLSRVVHSLVPKFFPHRGLNNRIAEDIGAAFDLALEELPTLRRTPLNARHHLAVGSPPPTRQSDFYGWNSFTIGNLMQPAEIKISARTLTALLGGEITLAEFREAHQVKANDGSPPSESLRRMLEEGRKLESIKLESMPGEDDDAIVLSFGSTDPAKVKFLLPDKH